MRFARPFRFGLVTVDEAPQAFVRVVVEVEGIGRRDRRHRRNDDAEMVRQEPGQDAR